MIRWLIPFLLGKSEPGVDCSRNAKRPLSNLRKTRPNPIRRGAAGLIELLHISSVIKKLRPYPRSLGIEPSGWPTGLTPEHDRSSTSRRGRSLSIYVRLR